MFCSNRFPLPGAPSTCVLDTAVVPLASFLLLVSLCTLSLRKITLNKDALRNPLPKWIHIVYMTLVAAAFAMTILEIARLAAEHLGVGLLPVTSIALVTVFYVLWKERSGRTLEMSALLAAYWLLLAAFEVLKSARLHLLLVLNPTTARNSQYPSSDQFLDNVVLVALFFLFCCAECTTMISLRRTPMLGSKSIQDV